MNKKRAQSVHLQVWPGSFPAPYALYRFRVLSAPYTLYYHIRILPVFFLNNEKFLRFISLSSYNSVLFHKFDSFAPNIETACQRYILFLSRYKFHTVAEQTI